MRARAVWCRKLLWILVWGAAVGCGGDDQGPPPPVAVAGATVALRHFKGLLGSPETLAQTTTNQTGNYQLSYAFSSLCEPQDNTTDWLEVMADGYQSASTFVSPEFSDPVILCTSEPQVINLSLQPLGSLRVLTSTSGSGLDPDGYDLVLDGTLAYPMGVNDEQVLPMLPGEYSLELTEIAGNCTVAGDNPRTVTVAARETTVFTFQVTCAP